MAVSPTAAKQRVTVSRSPEGSDVGDAAPPTKVKGKGEDRFLPISILLSALVICTAYTGVNLIGERYTLFSPSSSAITVVFRMDRVAGTLSVCTLQECKPVKDGP